MLLQGKEFVPELIAPIAMDLALGQIESSMRRGLSLMKKRPERGLDDFSDTQVQIIGFGRTLRDTYRLISNNAPIVTTSGAHDFLLSRHITPSIHVEVDPRAHKALAINRPDKRVKYYIASSCHPDLFDRLTGCDVTIFHADEATEVVAKWAETNDPETALLGGGSNAGLRSMVIASHVFNARRFKLFGVDCSVENKKRHAGMHFGPKKDNFVVAKTCGREFVTTLPMVKASEELIDMMDKHDVELESVGDSMATAMVVEANRQLAIIRSRKVSGIVQANPAHRFLNLAHTY
jgi:hypothetical protein